jgi:hypothetical protein
MSNSGPNNDNPSSWFPIGQNNSGGWRLDVVTLLAVIGESSMTEHSQAITASFLCLLPRIIPAPQALLKPSRPGRMPEVTAKMAGVYSGVVLDSVGFFANIIHPLDQLQPFAFKVLEIKHKELNQAGGIVTDDVPARLGGWTNWFRRTGTSGLRKQEGRRRGSRIPGPPSLGGKETSNGQRGRRGGMKSEETLPPGDSANVTFRIAPDPEQGGIQPQLGLIRRRTMKENLTDILANPKLLANQTLANNSQRPAVPAALYSPVHILSFVSFLLTLALVGTAAYWKDGTAIVAVSAISVASSIVGYASWWEPMLMNRNQTNPVPKGDVVIRTREGAFVLVRCTEEVARELYSGTEECKYYVNGRDYRAWMGVGTVMLMVSVILLGNCNWNSQVFIGASYITLNGLYWAMGMLKKEYFWDLSRYEWKDVTPEDARHAHKTTKKSFTRTLWYVIRETKRTGWVERSGAMPGTDQWRQWLQEAASAAKRNDRNWPSVQRKDEIMKGDESDGDDTDVEAVDPAEQQAPLIEVQPRRMDSNRLDPTF